MRVLARDERSSEEQMDILLCASERAARPAMEARVANRLEHILTRVLSCSEWVVCSLENTVEGVPWKTAAGSAAGKVYSAEGDLVRG